MHNLNSIFLNTSQQHGAEWVKLKIYVTFSNLPFIQKFQDIFTINE